MQRIGFIGLGTMGMPMAGQLQKAGYPLTVYNRTRGKAEKMVEKGARMASSPADVARHSEVIFTMLTADQAVEEVILGEQGVIRGASAGLIVVDCSTVSPQTSQKIARELKTKGVAMLDAPVTGSEPQAEQGILTFMVGGKKEVFERCLPLFHTMGKNAYWMGDHGAGSYTKLAINAIAAVNLAALSEGMVLAAKSGIDPELFLKVITGGGARSGMADAKAPKMIRRDFRPHFTTALMYKDLGLADCLAADQGVPAPLLSLVRQLFQMAIAKGYAEEDMCAVVKCYEDWAGVEVNADR
jgi:3-hydroxyisobutyrate dehydrogenase-like beta-hydroxyacid dehydrogenase